MFEIPSFEEIEKELLSSEEEVEEVRRAQMSSWGGKSLIWGSVIIFLTLLVSYLTDFFPYGLFIGAVLLVFVISGLYSSCKSEVSAVYKEKIIGKLTRMMLKDGEYLPNSGITENIFLNSWQKAA